MCRNPGGYMSTANGKGLADTIRTLGCYGNAIILRQPTAGSSQTAANVSSVPLINAGILDVYSIREELGTVNGMTITVVGDLKNG
ncbi:hypothetical protein PCASD_09119 [Puccinia coronata f. sp. avenae]|uniref:Aspartate/ornithine carbamoyltransferase carbamoyl-P binding domain-containing protein n=1 Tax=Puccinia coronata f. sp. avenae TaxID=200324 RepID=A0A2N5V4I9_9BASI|nr:hypothetical protein PCASD_09119 [Puccinia coronata f. sp. avenae]